MPISAAERRHLTIDERFTAFCAAIVRILPFGLSEIVPANLIGFGIINGFGFLVDMGMLALLRDGFGMGVRFAFTISYACAFTLSFWLNRQFNFHSHAPVGKEGVRYLGVVAVNYLVFILGLGAGLTELGFGLFFSRITAACCEAVYMYCAMRWFVFRGTKS